MARILLVDDDPQALASMRKILEFEGHELSCASDGQEALEIVRPSVSDRKPGFDVIITDVRMPRMTGLEFLKAISLCSEDTPVILMTAFGRVEDAVWVMRLGAVDFLTKPFKRQSLLQALEIALERSRAKKRERGGSAARDGSPSVRQGLLGDSEPMRKLKAMIEKVAPTSASVLIRGESGSGKEKVARNIHEASPRSSRSFVALNCAAIPEHLIESELFGHEKGAFTGATSSKQGLFEAADGGTLLLDEIGDMPLLLQAKLLRVLQEGEVRRLGATHSRKINVRVLAATHRDLRAAVESGQFRQDLLFRLEVIAIDVPALRDRKADLPLLASAFLADACERHGRTGMRFSEDALQILMTHSWPGNVRELANVVERSVVFSNSPVIEPEALPPHLGAALGLSRPPRDLEVKGTIAVPLGTTLREVEDLLIKKTLEYTEGDKNMTAKILGINSRTIYRKLDKQSDAATPETPAE